MNPKLKELGVSTIRTSIAPFVGALVLQQLAKWGVNYKPGAGFWSVITFILSGLWYVLFRGFEVLSENPKVKKWAGVFLGYPRAVTPTNTVIPMEIVNGPPSETA